MSAGDHSSANYTKDDFARDIPVSRETLERLTLYASLLERWQKTLNLVSKTTLSDIWQRHMLDFKLQAYSRRQPKAPSWISAPAPDFLAWFWQFWVSRTCISSDQTSAGCF